MHPQPSEVLYILGNGFDVAHGIESRYSDFEEWVKSKDNQRLVDMMDIFFSNKHSLWNDIETALGEYDEESIFEWCRPDENIDYDHPTRSIAAVEDSPNWIFKPILEEFLGSFIQWVNSVDISQAKPQQTLDKSSKYITFNYTETLEKIYDIPSRQILHIHGSRLVKNDAYIIGHNNVKSENLHDATNGEFYFEQDTKNKIIGWMNELHKNTQYHIKRNQQFFQSLNNVTHVVVRGHSLNEIDWPYFDEVRNNVVSGAKWIFYYHDAEKNIKQIDNYIAHSGITNYNLKYC